MSANVLDAIVASAKRSADERERVTPREALLAAIDRTRAGRCSFAASLKAPGIRVIAECKRRSPSRGILRQDYDPAAIATSYAASGAAAISVLTEPTFFDGSLGHLERVRAVVDLPLLRKDFVVTEYQVAEAARCGADAVLLIVAALEQAHLVALLGAAEALGLDALVEVHDGDELDRALDAGATTVGVNSRNLRTLQVNTNLLDELGAKIPAGVIGVAESGLKTPDDIRRLSKVGYRAFLIGERFMSHHDPGAELRHLLDAVEAVQ